MSVRPPSDEPPDFLEYRGDVGHSAEVWETLDALWRSGSLEHLLDETQLEIYHFIRSNKSTTVYVSAARQLGKSFANVVIALEDCIRNPGKRVNYVAKTFGALKKMIEQTMDFVASQAPEDCRPVFVVSESRWEFPVDGPARGAFIQLVGADEHRGADRCRGGSIVKNIVDEAGFIDCLEYLLNSVIKPMGRRTGAQTILSTSPAFSPDHYSCEIEDICAANGSLIVRDYWAPGMQSREEKQRFLEAEAKALNLTVEQFKRTTNFRREYMCERVLDESLAVVPEFAATRDSIIVARPRPPHFDLYVSADPGMDDKTGMLFAVTDFLRGRLLIEHELLLDKANTKVIAEAFQEVLAEHYPLPADAVDPIRINLHRGEQGIWHARKPYSAVIDDASKRVCADLHAYHGLSFSPALKDDREAAINAMRLEIAAHHIEINPRCVNLIRQLGTAIRTKPGGDMARSKRDAHFDLISSLWYLVRSWNKTRNPYPADWNISGKVAVREKPPRQTLGQAIFRGTSFGRKN